jgi:predicted DNA-binding transcriptional regulator YafY
MARVERLMDLADFLRGRDATTVAQLARELNVSSRTVLRDLAALRDRGVPIAAQAGPGGGVRLERVRGLTDVGFSLAEIVGIWLAARLSRETSDLPWGEAASSALGKVLASLPAPKARDLRTLCRRVIIGPPASDRIRTGAGLPPLELLRIFEDAFSRGRGLTFQYLDRDGAESRRTIEPHGLLVQTPVWYILSRDVEKVEPRTFRMDRISKPRMVQTVAFQPDVDVIRVQFPQRKEWRPLVGSM